MINEVKAVIYTEEDYEKFVKSHWEHVRLYRDIIFIGDSFNSEDFDTYEFYTWEDAARFTQSRLDEIHDIRNGILLLEGIDVSLHNDTWKNIILREKDFLIEKERGIIFDE
jgi:hypothetical protein